MFGRKKGPSVSLIEKPLTPLMKVGPAKKAVTLTQIIVRFDCGFGNALFIRGEGAGLSWEKGKVLRNVKANEWLFETLDTFTECSFKIVFNDERYEIGENHSVACGKAITIEPHF